MPLWPAFVGGAYRTRSPIIAASTLVNLYLEQTESQADVKRAVLYGTPGLRPLFNTAGSLGCRGMFQQDGRVWAVYGANLFEFDFALTTATMRGTMIDDGKPVTFASNGRGGEQLAVCGAGQLYILRLTTNLFTGPIALPGAFIPVMVDFIDGYFLMNEKDTPKIWFSALEDGLLWNGLDFFARSETSDNIIGFKVLGNRIWALGSQTSELFYNTGDNLNPFAPFPGTVMQEGCVSPWSITVVGESLAWLAGDNQGQGWFAIATSPQPEVISTPPVGYALKKYVSISDCEVLAYKDEEHQFVCWTFPSSPRKTTWCYDLRTKEWHTRQGFDEATGLYVRWRARGLCSVGQTIVVGDYATDDVYALDLETFDDNGVAISRERTAPYIGTDNQQLFLDQLEVGMEAGVGLNDGQGSNPKLMLDISWDGAKTWGPVTTATIGAMGNYGASAVWHQLGSGRQDRLVVRVRQTDPVRAVWGPGAFVRVTPGTGQR